ncbi:hypothetical protein BDQ17DRAFT_1256353, partial [Cyathus striatus]
YEYSITLDLEVKFIWNAPWKFMKIIYLMTRYLPAIDISLVLLRSYLPIIDETATLLI